MRRSPLDTFNSSLDPRIDVEWLHEGTDAECLRCTKPAAAAEIFVGFEDGWFELENPGGWHDSEQDAVTAAQTVARHLALAAGEQ